MRRFSTGRRHTRPIAIDPPEGPPPGGTPDDLLTWGNSASIETKVLPGTASESYDLIVDVTNIIDAAAVADTTALRFVRSDGVRMGHYRTTDDRILLVGKFFGGGKNRINYYWNKAAVTQPGVGFPTHAEMMAPYRLALIFDGGAPVDFSNDPATFTVVGTPTFPTGLLGQSMQCALGSYVETMATKLRGDARDSRSVFVLTNLPTTSAQARTVCWANWLTDQRAFQLWVTTSGVLELYISDDGTTFTPWRIAGGNISGWHAIAGSWRANVAETYMLLNDTSDVVLTTFDMPIPRGPLFNSNDPYIVGGTKVPDSYHEGQIECQFELIAPVTSVNPWQIWKDAWLKNDVFWGKADRTPDSIDVPDYSNAPLSTEVSFASKEITGISSGTPVSVSGDGSPTYSLGSSFGTPTDIKAKGTSAGLADSGNWLSTHHTTPATNSTVTESAVTVGTVTSPRKSTTIAASTGGGGSGIPEGEATVTVSTLAALKTAIGNAQGGQIIEILEGDYKPQGSLAFSNRDFRSYSQPLVIRASRRAYRGYLPSQGGLWVPGESRFVSGSGGAEFNGGQFKNIHNIVFDGLRFYQGPTQESKWYSIEIGGGSSYIYFQYCKFSGFKPDTDEATWEPYVGPLDPYPNGWGQQGRGLNLGRSLKPPVTNIHVRHCMFHYHGMQLDFADTRDCSAEDCLFTDSGSDHMRTDGAQPNLILRRNIFYRQFPQQGSGVDVAHPDAIQNTTKTQSGWQNHTIEDCIMSVGDGGHGKMQGFFYECDNYPQYPRGYGNRYRRNIMHAPSQNTITFYPADNNFVDYCTILKDMSAKHVADTNNIILFVEDDSFNNNRAYRCVYQSISKSAGDSTEGSTQLRADEYETELVHYPNSWKKAGFTLPRIINPYTGVLNLTHLGFMAPKANSRIHPNQVGHHLGASQRFQDLGVLP